MVNMKVLFISLTIYLSCIVPSYAAIIPSVSETKNTLLAVNHQQSQLINLNGNNQCNRSSPVAHLPRELISANGFTLNNELFVCGGLQLDTRTSTRDCYKYNHAENKWILIADAMLEGRFNFPSISYNKTHQLFIGGMPAPGQHQALATVELFNGVESVPFGHLASDTGGPLSPWQQDGRPSSGARRGSCAVKLNETHVFISGGYPFRRYAEIYKLGDEGLEKTLEMWMDHSWEGHSCGMVENNLGETEVVLSSGEWEYDTDIVNIPNRSIREGPRLPGQHKFSERMSTFQYNDSFLVVGGKDVASSSRDHGRKTISQFQRSTESYVMREEELEISGAKVYSFLVEDDMFNCG